MTSPFSSLATWPDTNTKPPAFVASERGSVRVPALLSSKNSIVIFGTFREEGLIDSGAKGYSCPVIVSVDTAAALNDVLGGILNWAMRFTWRLVAVMHRAYQERRSSPPRRWTDPR